MEFKKIDWWKEVVVPNLQLLGVMILMFGNGWLIGTWMENKQAFGITNPGYVGVKMIKECEKSLPRDQHCVIEMKAVVK